MQTWRRAPLPRAADTAMSAFNWCGRRKMIALTFDDGPLTEKPSATAALLNDLRAASIRATFFLSPAAQGPVDRKASCRLLTRMIREGHEVQCRKRFGA